MLPSVWCSRSLKPDLLSGPHLCVIQVQLTHNRYPVSLGPGSNITPVGVVYEIWISLFQFPYRDLCDMN